MNPLRLIRAPAPLGWAALALIAFVAAAVLGHGLGFRWDPLGLGERRRVAAEARAEAASADAIARRLEVEGAAEVARRLDNDHQQRLELARAAARAEARARSAHDADITLDPDRSARLDEHDRELCRLAPALCRPASPDAASRRD